MNDNSNDVPLTLDGNGGVQRRTIVAGASWTIPVIAIATATPAAAASLQPTLEFITVPATVDSCATLGDVVIEATTDGSAPVADGTLVTVTLPPGLTWSDGTTTPRTLPTTSGRVTVTGLKATGTASGPVTLTASSGTLLTPATVTVSPVGVATFQNSGEAPATYPAVPGGSTAVGYNTFLARDGSLWRGNSPLGVFATPGTVDVQYDPRFGIYTSYVDASGVASFLFPDGTVTTNPLVPAGSENLSYGFWLAPDGGFYYVGSGATVYASALPGTGGSAYSVLNASTWFTYIDPSGVATFKNGGDAPTTYPAVPAGSTAVGYNTFLAPDGSLWRGNSPLGIFATPGSVDVQYDPRYGVFTTYRDATGVASYYFQDGTVVANPAVPAGSTNLTYGFWLSPDGGFYASSGNTVYATAVPGTGGSAYSVLNASTWFTYMAPAC
ncbi:hypothetical protein [Rathayibacter sp. Leaf296]|uniref:hypothetical protein n=1 Tax=Rathayibacter sp. Leaf296 TaxID=1736327 RepID=UPI00070304FB|nr:hypothetical protein [Rathayibacter sp. Leaf296]KQQ10148.1 hypothetical protein ASF46_03390 [Rathayibacter sp. Leaf296]